jgi:hypothetical protein
MKRGGDRPEPVSSLPIDSGCRGDGVPAMVGVTMTAGTRSRAFLAVTAIACLAWHADASLAAEKELVIEGIRVETRVEGKVGVFVQLNGFFAAKCFTISGTPLRLVCDFAGADLAKSVRRKIDVRSDIVLRIRVGLHREPKKKVRIVLELDPARDYVIDQLFVKKDNQYVLVVEPDDGH